MFCTTQDGPKNLAQLFSVVFKTLDISQGNVATHVRCAGIFSDYKFLSEFCQRNNLENLLIFGKFKTYNKIVPIFVPPVYTCMEYKYDEKFNCTSSMAINFLGILTCKHTVITKNN